GRRALRVGCELPVAVLAHGGLEPRGERALVGREAARRRVATLGAEARVRLAAADPAIIAGRALARAAAVGADVRAAAAPARAFLVGGAVERLALRAVVERRIDGVPLRAEGLERLGDRDVLVARVEREE